MKDINSNVLPHLAEGDAYLSEDSKVAEHAETGLGEDDIDDDEIYEIESVYGTDEFEEYDDDSVIITESDPAASAGDATKRSPKLVKIVRKNRVKQSNLDIDFVDKVWKAFFALNLFIIPSLIGLVLGMILTCLNHPAFDGHHVRYNDVIHPLMLAFLGAATVVGLPFHFMAMDDLEIAVLEAKDNLQQQFKNSTRTTTTWYYV